MHAADAELRERLRGAAIDAPGIRAYLDGLSHGERVAAIRFLGRAQQRRLFDAVDGFAPLQLTDLVPAAVSDFSEVRHCGVNSLPVFTRFEKRFCRPRGADPERPGVLFGFNHQRLAALTGPGYFVAWEDPQRREVWIDYATLPDAHPAGWPRIRPNDAGVARFVFGGMVDTLRRVSEHIAVGSAARRGRELGSWFVLCREDPARDRSASA